eukprot:jgi/Chrzof1/9764/Cz04g14280.t1
MPHNDAADPAPSASGRSESDLERQGLLDAVERKNSKTLRAAVTTAPREDTVCSAILLPIVVTFYVTYHFLKFFDSIFSPLYKQFFKIEVFGLGFVTSVLFVTMTGVFFSSWLGSWMLSFGEWIIKRLPLVKHIYSASKQVSAALNPEGSEGTKAFQECVLIRHPRHGEFAYGFITGRTVLQTREGDLRLNCVYVPTNHVYVGDIYMLEDKDVIHTTLSVREGLEIVVSVGMAVPPTLSAITKRLS